MGTSTNPGLFLEVPFSGKPLYVVQLVKLEFFGALRV
jgi:hypothetical protein